MFEVNSFSSSSTIMLAEKVNINEVGCITVLIKDEKGISLMTVSLKWQHNGEMCWGFPPKQQDYHFGKSTVCHWQSKWWNTVGWSDKVG